MGKERAVSFDFERRIYVVNGMRKIGNLSGVN